MAVTRNVGTRKRTVRVAIFGKHGTGKSTFGCEACAKYNGIIIDTNGGTDTIRDSKTVFYQADSFGDVIEAYKMAVKENPGLIFIDDISVPWKSWQDHWGAKYNGRIPIHVWSTIKRPWRELMHLIQTSKITTIVGSRISYEMDTEGDNWKVDKNKYSAQAD